MTTASPLPADDDEPLVVLTSADGLAVAARAAAAAYSGAVRALLAERLGERERVSRGDDEGRGGG